MTMPDQSKGDRSRDEVLAGEYVLGVLGTNARREVEARIRRDRQFAAIVQRWEDNLAHFDDEYEPVAPPAALQARIEARLFTHPALERSARSGLLSQLWGSLLLWRGLALASIGTLLVIAGQQGAVLFAPKPRPLMATMSGTDRAVALLANFDATSGVLRIAPAAVGGPRSQSLELWLVEDGQKPRSLGVLPNSGAGEIKVADDARKRFAAGAVLAVSVEPFGGSPTGVATGPVIASGSLHP